MIRIGVTTEVTEDWESQFRPYADALEAWGAKPVPISRDLVAERGTRPLLESLDGLLASGGPDIALLSYPVPPDLGGRTPEESEGEHSMSTTPDRDEYEIPLVTRAIEMDIPVFGICRGVQVINVCMGGRLVLHIPEEERLGGRVEHRAAPPAAPGGARVSGCHPILLVPTSRLAQAIAPAQLHVVNSRHHQGILREMLGRDLEPVAFSPEDGLIEAVESPKHRWVIGVQWHPERPQDRYVYEPCRPLFRSFVDACRLTRLLR